MFSGLPPKADFPILELLPPPVLRERRHRGLARRLVVVRRRAVFVVLEGERPHPRLPPALPQLRPILATRALDRLDIAHAAAIPMGAEPAASRCSELVE